MCKNFLFLISYLGDHLTTYYIHLPTSCIGTFSCVVVYCVQQDTIILIIDCCLLAKLSLLTLKLHFTALL